MKANNFFIPLFLSATVAAAAAPLDEELTLLKQRIAQLESSLGLSCGARFPLLEEGGTMFYEGCNRNVARNTTRSVESCQNGTVTFYNTSDYGATGLFDLRITANVPTHDSWNFVCTFTVDRPHTATCTLTFEDPPRAEGPAWVEIRFRDLVPQQQGGKPREKQQLAVEKGSSDGGDGVAGECVAQTATIVGTYFYDALTNDAGVYSFYATTDMPTTAGGRAQ